MSLESNIKMSITHAEQIENRKKWVEALRSGEYTQTIGMLKDHHGYCCLGVLCHIAGTTFYPDCNGEYYVRNGKDEILFGVTTENAMEWVGLRTSDGAYGENDEQCLANHNDEERLNFDQIATIIESNPPGLFIDND